jgi:hypothetical protein
MPAKPSRIIAHSATPKAMSPVIAAKILSAKLKPEVSSCAQKGRRPFRPGRKRGPLELFVIWNSARWRFRCRSSSSRIISRARSDNMTTVLRWPSHASLAFWSMSLIPGRFALDHENVRKNLQVTMGSKEYQSGGSYRVMLALSGDPFQFLFVNCIFACRYSRSGRK